VSVVDDELLDLERRRCAAIADDDFDALRELLSDRLIHIHTRGNRDTRDSYLEFLATVVEILDVQRTGLEVERFGDCAVMTGRQVNTARRRGSDDPPIRVESRVIQVWTRTDGRWLLAAFQATLVGEPPAVVVPR
jgi:ketosteroid isomerase-like protein